MLNLGLLGTGNITERSLLPALKKVPEVRLWSVLSRDLSRAKAFAAKHGAAAPAPAFADLSAMLADRELHAVLIATPDALHAEQAVAAAKAGKHVLTEKPMATGAKDARAMVEACRAAGVKLGVAYHLRWHAGHRLLAERLRSGALGNVLHARTHWTYKAADDSNWRAHEDVGRWWGLAGVGTHALDFLRWMAMPTAGEIAEVASVISRPRFKGPHDETAVVAMRFEKGATAELTTSVLFASTPRGEIYTDKTSIVLDGTFGPHGAGTIKIGDETLAFTPVDPYVGEIADFAAAIRENRDPEVPGEEGARNVEILLRAAPK